MSAVDLLGELSRLGVKLWREGEQLRFQAPKGALTPDLKARLVERKLELVDFLRQVQTRGPGAGLPAISRTGHTGDAPLSYAQERLWFLDQWEPGGAAYNIFDAIAIEGRLQVAALEQSLTEIARRHETLRTTFTIRDGQPRQAIAKPGRVPAPAVDLSALPGSGRDGALADLIRIETARPFDLNRGPLLRVQLFRLEPRRHVLLFNLHHIISDGWSTGVLVRELAALYHGFSQGRPSPLPELPLQYADFARWQRQWMDEKWSGGEVEFWKQRLKDSPASLELPTDHPRPAARTTRGATHAFLLPAELSQAVRAASRQEGATLFMILLAAWYALLGRYSGQERVVVGTPVANRNRTELEGLIGFFVNTLPLGADLSGDPSFRELLARVREGTLAAQDHQDLPFERLAQELQPPRDPGRTPIFQVAFVFQNAPMPEMAAPGLTLRRLPLPTDTAKFDVTLTMTDSARGLEAEIEYSADLFEPASMARLARHFETLLASAVAGPGRRLSELRLLSAPERRQIVEQWNATATAYPGDEPIHESISRQARRTPDAIAVVFEGMQLTYRDLDRRANQLAWTLRGLGAGPETLVGIAAERSLELVVGLLGILKAGAAYLPFDTGYPAERLAYLLADARPAVVLTEQRLRDKFAQAGVPVVCLDAPHAALAEAEGPPPAQLHGASLAYVIYTSGSTGHPKGAMNTHAGIRNRLLWMQQAYRLEPADRVLQKTPFSFDVSVWEFFWPLMVGARLIVARPEGHRDAAYLIDLIAAEGLTTAHFVPSMLRAFLEQPDVERCASLRRVICSGEALPPDLQERFFARLHCELHNLYGPTEAAVDVTFWPCRPETAAATVPIGRPIANIQIYILDAHLRPVPAGVPGELHIAGAGLGRGYLDRPGLTAEKFLPNPFARLGGERLYRSGDLARYLADGTIEYLGRLDHQVKLRGFRIELGEIEVALEQHSGVRHAVVAVREDQPGDRKLVAYVVPAEPAGATAKQLRAWLREKLPDYMAPAAYVFLAALPLSPNGKLDRRALPPPDGAGHEAGAAPPRRPEEELLAGLWGNLLKLDRVGVDQDFFELGGHSLLAAQLVARIADAFQVTLPLRAVFEAPTVGGLSERIRAALLSGDHRQLPAIERVARDGPAPLSYLQENLWLYEQLSPGTPTYNTCRSGRVSGPLNAAAVEGMFDQLLRRHEILRTSYRAVDGRPVQEIHRHARWALPVVDLSGLPAPEREAEALRLSNENAARPLDLTAAPAARAQLLRLAPEDHVFILSIHHIAYDLWSGSILLEEMERAYLACARGEPLRWTPLPAQYVDFAVWQRSWFAREEFGRELAYWKRQLAGVAAEPMRIPTDRPRPAADSMRGGSRQFRLSKALSERLRALAIDQHVTEFMALLAVFQVLLHRYTGQDDVVAGSVISNRNSSQLDGVVGFFDNTVVLRSDAAANPTFRDFLGRVREVALEAYAHQHLPFDRLVEELQPERASHRTPLIQAMFVFLLNYPAMERELAGLQVVPYNLDSGKAMFDLLLAVRESEQGLVGELAYHADLFDPATIVRMCGHFEQLAESAAADPDQRIDDLPMLSAGEREQALAEGAGADTPYPRACIQQLFEAQVERTPDAVALVWRGVPATWRELNGRANQLAHHLQRLGAGPEARVGVCLPRSTDLVVALLAILKTGAAYVPLDPGYPAGRIADMAEDASLAALVTGADASALAAGAATVIVHLDAEWPHIATESARNLRVAADPDNLAYIIYTSGSTGRPKGVAIPHACAAAFLGWADRSFPLEWRDGLVASTSVCFDLSIFELFLPLCYGGRILLIDDILALPQLRGERVTLVNTVPSALRELLNAGALPDSLRILNLAGEPLAADLAQRVYAGGRVERLHNLYGPSETTTYSTWSLAPRESEPTIGGPIANTRIYILDAAGNPVPVGVPADLYIGAPEWRAAI